MQGIKFLFTTIPISMIAWWMLSIQSTGFNDWRMWVSIVLLWLFIGIRDYLSERDK